MDDRRLHHLSRRLRVGGRLAWGGEISKAPSISVGLLVGELVGPCWSREAAGAIPGCDYKEVAGAGHIGIVTHPDDTVGHLVQFFRTAPFTRLTGGSEVPLQPIVRDWNPGGVRSRRASDRQELPSVSYFHWRRRVVAAARRSLSGRDRVFDVLSMSTSDV